MDVIDSIWSTILRRTNANEKETIESQLGENERVLVGSPEIGDDGGKENLQHARQTIHSRRAGRGRVTIRFVVKCQLQRLAVKCQRRQETLPLSYAIRVPRARDSCEKRQTSAHVRNAEDRRLPDQDPTGRSSLEKQKRRQIVETLPFLLVVAVVVVVVVPMARLVVRAKPRPMIVVRQ